MSSPPLQGTWEVVIHRPVFDVWRVLDDSANLPRWCDFFVKETTGTTTARGAGAHRERYVEEVEAPMLHVELVTRAPHVRC